MTNTAISCGHYVFILFARDLAVLHVFTVWSASAVGIEGHVERVRRTCVRSSWRLPVISNMMQYRARRRSASLAARSVFFVALVSAVLQVGTTSYVVPYLFSYNQVFVMVKQTSKETLTFPDHCVLKEGPQYLELFVCKLGVQGFYFFSTRMQNLATISLPIDCCSLTYTFRLLYWT